MSGPLNYEKSGVDRAKADLLVERIAKLSKRTLNKKVVSRIGGYAALYDLGGGKLAAATTDGVGTKLKLAFELGDHRTIGIDLVAMSANDLICVGAEPAFFLDYLATGKLQNDTAEAVLDGIVTGCERAGMALVGGETAEMPDFYAPGEYDLGGFAVGFLKKKDVLPRASVKPGQVLIGLKSSGCHSNGYSLLRRLLDLETDRVGRARELLTPTTIYVKQLAPLIKKGLLTGMAHITGSGFLNVPRISEKVSYEIDLPPLDARAAIYKWVYEKSGLSLSELSQTFNCGIGMVLCCEAKKVNAVVRELKKSAKLGGAPVILGKVIRKKPGSPSTVLVRDPFLKAEVVLS